MTTAAEHIGTIAIVPVGNGYSAPRIECACGWHGPARERATQAHIDQQAHLADVGIRPRVKDGSN